MTDRPDGWESPAAHTLGKKTLIADKERAYVKHSFVAGPSFINRNGVVHGGFLVAMLDSLCGHAVRTTHGDAEVPQVTLELKTSFIGRALPGELVGEGWVRHRGKSIAFAEAELRSADGNLVARASATFKIGKS